jgi:hypothetical protein
MTAKAHGHRPIAVLGEVLQEILIPAPGGVPSAVDKEYRRFIRVAARSRIDHVEHEPDSFVDRHCAPWVSYNARRD